MFHPAASSILCTALALPLISTGCYRDADGDGILGPDSCSEEPEDFDGFSDEDGCPDPNNDGDSLADVDDHCPNAAADGPTGCPATEESTHAEAPSVPEEPGRRVALAEEISVAVGDWVSAPDPCNVSISSSDLTSWTAITEISVEQRGCLDIARAAPAGHLLRVEATNTSGEPLDLALPGLKGVVLATPSGPKTPLAWLVRTPGTAAPGFVTDITGTVGLGLRPGERAVFLFLFDGRVEPLGVSIGHHSSTASVANVAAPERAEQTWSRVPAGPVKDERLFDEGSPPCSTAASITAARPDGYSTSGVIHRANGRFWLWCDGAQHTWVGKFEDVYRPPLRQVLSDEKDPLVFALSKTKGYLRVKGKGTLRLENGTEMVFR